MFADECLRIVTVSSLLFAAWFGLVGWSQFREGGRCWRFLGTMAGLGGGCLTIFLAITWVWSALIR